MQWQDMSLDEKTTKIKDWLKQRASASTIALALGTSKSAVLGHMHRNKIKAVLTHADGARITREIRQPQKPRTKPNKPRAANTQEGAGGPVKHPPTQVTFSGSHTAPWLPLGGAVPVALEDVGARCCTWPLWKTDDQPKVFCGLSVEHKDYAYCNHHLALAYNGRIPERKRGMIDVRETYRRGVYRATAA